MTDHVTKFPCKKCT